MREPIRRLIAFAVVGIFVAASARADLSIDDPIDVNGFANDIPLWGTHSMMNGTSDNGLPHLFGGLSQFENAELPGLGLDVLVSSDEIFPPPPGKTFAGFIILDFTFFEPESFLSHHVDILGLKEPDGANFINGVSVVFGPGLATTDGFNIFWDGSGEDLMFNPVVVIEWTQIPAPAGLAVLGLAGMLGGVRRRR